MQTNPRQKLLLFVALGAVAFFLGDRLVIGPLTTAWKARQERIAQLKLQIANGQTLVDREQVIRSRWNQMQRTALPADQSATEQLVFKAIDGWARDSRVTVTAVLPQWRKDAPSHTTYQCRIDASGGIRSLSQFLFNLERDSLPVKVETLELGANDKQGQQLSLVLQFSALVLNPDKP